MTTQATPIVILPTQLSQMIDKAGINSATPNYHAMYDYIFKTFGDKMPDDQKYWFEQAGQINQFLNNLSGTPSPSAYFIYQMNKESLKAAGLNYSDANIAKISNAIGANVRPKMAVYLHAA